MRGAGVLAARKAGKGRGSMRVRWAAVADSVAVVGYSGPVHALDAVFLGDSVYAALRPYDLGFAGTVPDGEGIGAPGLRFLAEPWSFGAPWIRAGIDRSRIEPHDRGWRMIGTLEGADGTRPFRLDLDRHARPVSLTIDEAKGRASFIAIRYGPVRRYSGGRLPRWIEWTHGDASIRLELEDYAVTKSRTVRHAPPANPDWTILALDDPRGRDLLRNLLGATDGPEGP
jgi:hypothetical protein